MQEFGIATKPAFSFDEDPPTNVAYHYSSDLVSHSLMFSFLRKPEGKLVREGVDFPEELDQAFSAIGKLGDEQNSLPEDMSLFEVGMSLTSSLRTESA